MLQAMQCRATVVIIAIMPVVAALVVAAAVFVHTVNVVTVYTVLLDDDDDDDVAFSHSFSSRLLSNTQKYVFVYARPPSKTKL